MAEVALTMDSRQPLLKGHMDIGRPWELLLGNETHPDIYWRKGREVSL